MVQRSRGQSGAQLPFQFTGQQTDAESGLQYLRGRYYDPATGRFLSQDPAATGAQNRYPYADDNPVTVIDPSGLDGINSVVAATGSTGSDSSTCVTPAPTGFGAVSSGCATATTTGNGMGPAGGCASGDTTQASPGVWVCVAPPPSGPPPVCSFAGEYGCTPPETSGTSSAVSDSGPCGGGINWTTGICIPGSGATPCGGGYSPATGCIPAGSGATSSGSASATGPCAGGYSPQSGCIPVGYHGPPDQPPSAAGSGSEGPAVTIIAVIPPPTYSWAIADRVACAPTPEQVGTDLCTAPGGEVYVTGGTGPPEPPPTSLADLPPFQVDPRDVSAFTGGDISYQVVGVAEYRYVPTPDIGSGIWWSPDFYASPAQADAALNLHYTGSANTAGYYYVWYPGSNSWGGVGSVAGGTGTQVWVPGEPSGPGDVILGPFPTGTLPPPPPGAAGLAP